MTPHVSPPIRQRLFQIFQETYRELRPRSVSPEMGIEFFAFANINNTIRLRNGKLLVRVSDLLEGAPENVLTNTVLREAFDADINIRKHETGETYVSYENSSH
jgi:ABC-type enterochelin transport system ATPase subunit